MRRTQPTASAAGTAAEGSLRAPVPTATIVANSAVTRHAPSIRRFTLTDARVLSSGDMASLVTFGRRSETRSCGQAARQITCTGGGFGDLY